MTFGAREHASPTPSIDAEAPGGSSDDGREAPEAREAPSPSHPATAPGDPASLADQLAALGSQPSGTTAAEEPATDPGTTPPPATTLPAQMDFVDEKALKPRECAFSLAMPDSDGDERRVAGRFPVDQVRCDQGRILDLSRTGLRLERLGRLPSGRAVPVMISDGETVVAVMCEVRWERKLGFMKWSYGLQFHGLTEADMRSITRIAANCREQRKFG